MVPAVSLASTIERTSALLDELTLDIPVAAAQRLTMDLYVGIWAAIGGPV